jgi:hypothetical protein
MAIPTESVFDLATPRRPTLADLGGAAFENYVPPPDETTMPSAQMENQNEMVLQSVARMMPVAAVYVTFPAGARTVTTVVAPGSNVAAVDFTLTDEGTGATKIAVAANTLPAETLPPNVRLYPPTVDVWTHAIYQSGGSWAVQTFKAGVVFDCPFVIEFF